MKTDSVRFPLHLALTHMPCDTFIGECSCGATHTVNDWPVEVRLELLKPSIPSLKNSHQSDEAKKLKDAYEEYKSKLPANYKELLGNLLDSGVKITLNSHHSIL